MARPLPLARTLYAVLFEADQAAQVLPDPGVAVVPIVAVHGAQVPWGKVVMDGVPVVSARRLPSMLRQLPVVLAPERVTALADLAPHPLSPCRLTHKPAGLRNLSVYERSRLATCHVGGRVLGLEVNRFRQIYNTIRPHQALHDLTPRDAYLAGR